MTGGVSAVHDIISVQTFSLTDPDKEGGSSYNSAGHSSKADQKRSNKPQIDMTPLGGLFYFAMLVIVLGIAYVAWNVYQQSKQQSFKRF